MSARTRGWPPTSVKLPMPTSRGAGRVDREPVDLDGPALVATDPAIGMLT
jgi:hypothetical protein